MFCLLVGRNRDNAPHRATRIDTELVQVACRQKLTVGLYECIRYLPGPVDNNSQDLRVKSLENPEICVPSGSPELVPVAPNKFCDGFK